MERKILKLIRDSKVPFTQVARAAGTTPANFRYYLFDRGLTDEQIKRLRKWAEKQAVAYFAIVDD